MPIDNRIDPVTKGVPWKNGGDAFQHALHPSTRRDYFAGQAFSGLLHACAAFAYKSKEIDNRFFHSGELNFKDFAKEAVRCADALIKELDK